METENITAEYNKRSIEFIQRQINKKLSGPYIANGELISQSVTDMDHHPYDRWFRGVPYFPDPVIFEREAGWRPLRDDCYTPAKPQRKPQDNSLCFEAACTTIFPCYNKGEPEKNVKTNRNCLVQYY